VWRAAPKDGAWTVTAALDLAATALKPALLGFDAPLGVPESFWRQVAAGSAWKACTSFASWIRLGPVLGEARTAEAWSLEHPFFAIPPGTGSRLRWEAALRERGITPLRRIDAATGAKPVFVVAGIPGSVGSAARDLWRGLASAHAAGRRFSIWPFEPAGNGLTVAEIYPRAAYALAL